MRNLIPRHADIVERMRRTGEVFGVARHRLIHDERDRCPCCLTPRGHWESRIASAAVQ